MWSTWRQPSGETRSGGGEEKGRREERAVVGGEEGAFHPEQDILGSPQLNISFQILWQRVLTLKRTFANAKPKRGNQGFENSIKIFFPDWFLPEILLFFVSFHWL